MIDVKVARNLLAKHAYEGPLPAAYTDYSAAFEAANEATMDWTEETPADREEYRNKRKADEETNRLREIREKADTTQRLSPVNGLGGRDGHSRTRTRNESTDG